MTAVTFSRADAGISGVFMSAETIAATTVFAAAGAAALSLHRALPADVRPEYGGGFLRCSAHKRILRDRHTATGRAFSAAVPRERRRPQLNIAADSPARGWR